MLCVRQVLGYMTRACFRGVLQSHNAFHTSCSSHGRRNLLKAFERKTKKKLWYESFSPKVPLTNQFAALKPTASKRQERGENPRIRILNSLLFKSITDLLCSHQLRSDTHSLGVEISKVSLPADFSSCRVYWRTSGAYEKDAEIQKALDRSSSRIRYLLISHQIMGSVPPVVFLKDKEYAAISEVENLLKIADFGEDPYAEGCAEKKQTGHSQAAGMLKRSNLFGIDHEMLTKQILDYKQGPKDSQTDNISAAALTQQQLDTLEEMRRQKLVNKKKKKAKRENDNDITPQAYLLARYSQEEQDVLAESEDMPPSS